MERQQAEREEKKKKQEREREKNQKNKTKQKNKEGMTEAQPAFYFSNYLDWDIRHVNESHFEHSRHRSYQVKQKISSPHWTLQYCKLVSR